MKKIIAGMFVLIFIFGCVAPYTTKVSKTETQNRNIIIEKFTFPEAPGLVGGAYLYRITDSEKGIVCYQTYSNNLSCVLMDKGNQ